jgi:hypothetical protein
MDFCLGCSVQTERWWSLYRDAVLETDPAKVEERIREAEEAIGARSSLSGQLPASEQSALEDACNRLQILKTERATSQALDREK